jgi:ring-1,2-phenylacetyl-CoA epoxidase subunit PaaB
MSDTQWPRYEVFVQEKEGRPYQNVGSVHAPDAEMALLNGRDVYARRPLCHSLWVVPAHAIFTQTAEELAAADLPSAPTPNHPHPITYLVCQKQSQRAAMTYVTHTGQVQAASPADALRQAIAAYDDPTRPTFVWWLFPATAVCATTPDDIPSHFAPALDKAYKHPQAFRTVTALRENSQ